MPPRLPHVGGDDGTWGQLLNDYLSQVHDSDGSLKAGVITTGSLADGAVTSAKVAAAGIATSKVAGLDAALAGKADASALASKADASALAAKADVATTYTKAQVDAAIAAVPLPPVRFSAAIATTGVTGGDTAYVARTIVAAYLRAASAPTGSDLVVMLESGSGSSWATVAGLTIAAGSSNPAAQQLAINFAQAANAQLRLNVTSVGSVNPAAGVVVDVVVAKA